MQHADRPPKPRSQTLFSTLNLLADVGQCSRGGWPRGGSRPFHQNSTYVPFIKTQLASRNYFSGLTWCRCVHVTPHNLLPTNLSYSTVRYRCVRTRARSSVVIAVCYASSKLSDDTSRSDPIAASLCDKYSVCPSFRPICTRCCFTMTYMFQVCGNFR
jgi:hypothetical protein